MEQAWPIVPKAKAAAHKTPKTGPRSPTLSFGGAYKTAFPSATTVSDLSQNSSSHHTDQAQASANELSKSSKRSLRRIKRLQARLTSRPRPRTSHAMTIRRACRGAATPSSTPSRRARPKQRSRKPSRARDLSRGVHRPAALRIVAGMEGERVSSKVLPLGLYLAFLGERSGIGMSSLAATIETRLTDAMARFLN